MYIYICIYIYMYIYIYIYIYINIYSIYVYIIRISNHPNTLPLENKVVKLKAGTSIIQGNLHLKVFHFHSIHKLTAALCLATLSY